MWAQADFPPDSFWQQTPLHFQIVMRGVRARLKSEAEARTAQAYEAGAFAGLAQHGKLKKLDHYLYPDKAQTPREMLAAIQSMGAKSNMKIRRLNS